MLCPHRKRWPLNCCRRGDLPAQRGLFCGGRAMSCSHGCLHRPTAAGDQAALPESGPSPTVYCSSQVEWLQNQACSKCRRKSLIWTGHSSPKAASNSELRCMASCCCKTPASWLNLAAKHACPWRWQKTCACVHLLGFLCSHGVRSRAMSSWLVCHPETKSKECEEINKC